MSHLATLAREPRPAGGVATSRARAYCASVLRRHSYDIVEESFEFSAFPGALGAPIVGGWAILTLIVVSICGANGHPAVALLALVCGAAALAVVARPLGSSGVLSLPFMRRRAVNMSATRGKGPPRVWLVAHIDSKWQPVPMLLRAAGVVLLVACGCVALALAIVQLANGVGSAAWPWVAGASVVAGLPVLLSFVGARNAGAVDNASGVATVLSAVELLENGASVGVLITDAEELALAGARAWCVSRAPSIALNCDSIDDHGMLTVMTIAPKGAQALHPRGRSTTPVGTPEVIRALHTAATTEGERLRTIALIPGILTDSVAFAAAGWTTVTLSRGTLRTLRRIHTMNDDLRAMHGTGIDGAARVLARAATLLACSSGTVTN